MTSPLTNVAAKQSLGSSLREKERERVINIKVILPSQHDLPHYSNLTARFLREKEREKERERESIKYIFRTLKNQVH